MTIESTRTVVEELRWALAALQTAEAVYYEKTGSDEFTDIIAASNAISRALNMIHRP